MKIAFVSQPYDGVRPPHQNSVGISVFELSRWLAKKHDVTVVTVDRPDSDQPVRDSGVRFHYLSIRHDLWLHRQYDRVFGILRWGRINFASRLFYFVYALRAALLLRRGGYDLIHLINLSQFVPVIRAFNPRTRIILNMRCEWLSQLPRKTVANRIRKTDLVIGCSQHITGMVQDRFPGQAAKCRTVYNGVDTTKFAFTSATDRLRKDGTKTILFVGRVSPEKGIHVLVDALPEISRLVPDLRVVIVGSQEQLPLELLVGLSDEEWVSDLKAFYPDNSPTAYISILREKLAHADLAHIVSFTGPLPYAEVYDQLRRADVLVNPSLSDAFPRAPVEAMATGLPVVAARVGGVIESVVDNRTGFLVEPASAESLATAVSRLLTDDELREKMGIEAHRHVVDNLSWRSVAEDLEHEYWEVISKND